MALTWIGKTAVTFSEEPLPSEYQVKAAFLINFPKYVDWPAEAFATPDSPVVIAVAGETQVTGELRKVIVGRTVNGRKLVLTTPPSGGESWNCHILFISERQPQQLQRILATIENKAVLTVGESEGFLESGGIINLTHREHKIALEVNLPAADKAGIKISSKLLAVAGLVKGRPR